MASVSMVLPLTSATQSRLIHPSETFIRPLSLKRSNKTLSSKLKSKSKLQVHASLKEKALAGLTATALTATMVIPEAAEAAGSDFSPSLKNFLLSIVVGGVVLAAIFAAVIGVSNFDPVKRT